MPRPVFLLAILITFVTFVLGDSSRIIPLDRKIASEFKKNFCFCDVMRVRRGKSFPNVKKFSTCRQPETPFL
jgi:hypothetical protein